MWLPSGGTLVIDRTEAMTVIDVNTGKFTGSGGNLEETVTRNNLEAAEEIVRQLRLRDIGGIIVIDFIDMVLEANRDLVLRRLTECLARDRTRHQVAEVTSLGLVQMTRKRVGGGLLEHFSTPCEHCRGRGVIVTTEPAAESNGRDRGERDRATPSRCGGAAAGGAGATTPTATGAGGCPPSSCPTCRGSAGARRARPGGAGGARVRSAGPWGGEPGRRCTGAGRAGSPRRRRWRPRPSRSVRDDVEEVVVEQALAVERNRHSAPNGRVGDGGPGLCAGSRGDRRDERGCGRRARSEPADTPEPVGRRRRGRVTRTAGAPTATAGDAPAVAVVTVPARASRRRGGRAAAAVDPRAVDPDAVDPRTVERRGLVLRAAGRRPARRRTAGR